MRVNTLFHDTSVMRASGDVVWTQLSTPLMQLMFGDGARIDSRSPCGNQFIFASVTCASEALIAAAFACRPGLPRAISSSCGSVSFLAQADWGAAVVATASSNKDVRLRTTHALPIMARHYTGFDRARRR